MHSREPRQVDAVSLGARAFWPAAAVGGGRIVAGLRPAAVLSGLRRFAASPESGSEDPRTQSTARAGSGSLYCKPSAPSEGVTFAEQSRAATAALSLGARAFRPAAAGGGGNNVAGLRPAAVLSGLCRFAASPESGPESPRTQSTARAGSDSLYCKPSAPSEGVTFAEQSRAATAALSLGARAFRPAAAGGGGNNVTGQRPAAALSGLRRFVASPESGPESPRTQSNARAGSDSLYCKPSAPSEGVTFAEQSHAATAALSLGARAFRPAAAGGGGNNVTGQRPAAALSGLRRFVASPESGPESPRTQSNARAGSDSLYCKPSAPSEGVTFAEQSHAATAALSLGARAFRPAAAGGGGNNVTGQRPAAALSGLRRFVASPESGPESPRTQSNARAGSDSLYCKPSAPSEGVTFAEQSRAATAALSLGARAFRPAAAGGGGNNVAGLWPAAALLTAALACTAPTDDRADELAARELGNPGGENFGEFGPPDAYEGDSAHPYYGSENEWSRRMFDERSANLYYKRRGQRQLLEILDGNPERAIELADARLAEDRADAESWFIKAVALSQLDRIDAAEAAMHAALDAGMPFGRFLAGPRELLAPLAATEGFALHAASPNNTILHGPMLGAVTDTSARVWIRTAVETRFEVVATADGERHASAGNTIADRDFTGVATLEGLSPDTSYEYEIRLEGQEQLQPPTYTLRTFPPAGAPGTFAIAFGGCAGYTPQNERIWDTIAAHTPQALLLLGDNVYIDLPGQPGPFHDYTYYQRQSRPEFRRLVSSTPVYAIWDDHDAAVDDIWMGPYVDRPAWKQPMVDLFRRNWNNPAYGSESHPGVWFRFALGDVDFFMLDGRTYRTNPFAEERTMLGPVQKAWLLESLLASEATFKVIASPVAWADGAKPGSRDAWSGFPEEREEIFGFIEANDIPGVILLSSDRHRSEAWAIERDSGYAFHDLLSGQLTNIHTHPKEPGALFSYNLKDSFGLLTFDTAREDPQVTYEIYSIDDELIETLVIPHADLAVTDKEAP